jgi:D-alanyl-D-alanine endopeptidase (penicillin-binding protein 7)
MIFEALATLITGWGLQTFFPTDAAALESQLGIEDPYVETYGIANTEAVLPEADLVYRGPRKVREDSYGIVTSAISALVVDDASGETLFMKRPNHQRSIGSVTKLVAAMAFLDTDPDLDNFVRLDPELDLVLGGRQYVPFYRDIQLRDVLAAAMIGSDNSATKSLMRFSGLTEEEFIAAMNRKAQEIGMDHSRFADPTGIDSANISTARDMIALLEGLESYPLLQEFTTIYEYPIRWSDGGITMRSTNGVLDSYLNRSPYQVLGGKTGYLPEARYVLISSVERGGNVVHIAVMGAETRAAREKELRALAEWTFATYSWE